MEQKSTTDQAGIQFPAQEPQSPVGLTFRWSWAVADCRPSIANVEREQRWRSPPVRTIHSAVDIGTLGPVPARALRWWHHRALPDNPAVEALETFFAAEVNGGLFELRLSAEQQSTGEAQSDCSAGRASSLHFKALGTQCRLCAAADYAIACRSAWYELRTMAPTAACRSHGIGLALEHRKGVGCT